MWIEVTEGIGMKKIIIALFILLIPCSAQAEKFFMTANLSYTITGNRSHSEVEIIQMGLRYWEDSPIGLDGVKVKYYPDAKDPDLTIHVNTELVKKKCDLSKKEGNKTLGCATKKAMHLLDDAKAHVYVREDMVPYVFYYVIRHEIGHTFALSHRSQPQPLMDAVLDGKEHTIAQNKYYKDLEEQNE